MKNLLFVLALTITFNCFGQDDIIISNTKNSVKIIYKSKIKTGKIVLDKNIEIETMNIKKLVYQSIKSSIGVSKDGFREFKKIKSINLSISDNCDYEEEAKLKMKIIGIETLGASPQQIDKCEYAVVVNFISNSGDTKIEKHLFDNKYQYITRSLSTGIFPGRKIRRK